jgi:hypothetical protein
MKGECFETGRKVIGNWITEKGVPSQILVV